MSTCQIIFCHFNKDNLAFRFEMIELYCAALPIEWVSHTIDKNKTEEINIYRSELKLYCPKTNDMCHR